MRFIYAVLILIFISGCDKYFLDKKKVVLYPNQGKGTKLPEKLVAQPCPYQTVAPVFCNSASLACLNGFIGTHTVNWSVSSPSSSGAYSGTSSIYVYYSNNCSQVIAYIYNPPCGPNGMCFSLDVFCTTGSTNASGVFIDPINGIQYSLTITEDPKVIYTCAQNGNGGDSYNGTY
ncbi:MAG: hypothetical protein JSU07_08010 [Bacteroidetes bacterium]|nr:hypothetical protein [Bacteroidota bacterium]